MTPRKAGSEEPPAPPPCEACLKADAMSTEFVPNRNRLAFRQVTIDTHHALLAAKDVEIARLWMRIGWWVSLVKESGLLPPAEQEGT